MALMHYFVACKPHKCHEEEDDDKEKGLVIVFVIANTLATSLNLNLSGKHKCLDNEKKPVILSYRRDRCLSC